MPDRTPGLDDWGSAPPSAPTPTPPPGRRRAVLSAVAALAVGLLVGAGVAWLTTVGDGDPQPPASGTGTTSPPTTAPADPTPSSPPSGTTYDVRSFGGAAFVSADGEVVCNLIPGEVRCDVYEPRYSPPPKPASCQAAWGPVVRLDRNGADYACVGDAALLPVLYPADAVTATGDINWFDPAANPTVEFLGQQAAGLGPGNRIVLGAISCTGLAVGVHCQDDAGRGFEVSLDRVRLSE
ncbi:hypothetical protein [Nocardioides daejeonensis]|uniref:hypothetical protein n=1 Tax=Nocardioides daejeonensis TaxID=1046556 RepID=UPI0013A5999A|nr:hypothetical protein [Nocardioides daejeonensis]